jgi:XRE family transcriptional regulator, regulator of sulfur utilization
MTLGEKIRQTRLQRGFSQENMADMLGISTTAFGDIERNKTELSIARAKEIANVLTISLLELLGLEIQEQNGGSFHAEKLQLENEKLKLEVEKLAFEAIYWREKFEERVMAEVYRILQTQNQRKQIGF